MSTDGDDGGGANDATPEERIVSLLESREEPRSVASDVARALDLPRGRVRTGLQTLADEGRVVRTDEDTTAWWAAPDRDGDPDPAEGQHVADAAGEQPDPDEASDGGPDGGAADGPGEGGEGSTGGPTVPPVDEPADGDAPEAVDRGATDGAADRSVATDRAWETADEEREASGRRLDARGIVALVAALVVVAAARRRLRRER
jgi:hypothetical protein